MEKSEKPPIVSIPINPVQGRLAQQKVAISCRSIPSRITSLILKLSGLNKPPKILPFLLWADPVTALWPLASLYRRNSHRMVRGFVAKYAMQNEATITVHRNSLGFIVSDTGQGRGNSGAKIVWGRREDGTRVSIEDEAQYRRIFETRMGGGSPRAQRIRRVRIISPTLQARRKPGQQRHTIAAYRPETVRSGACVHVALSRCRPYRLTIRANRYSDVHSGSNSRPRRIRPGQIATGSPLRLFARSS